MCKFPIPPFFGPNLQLATTGTIPGCEISGLDRLRRHDHCPNCRIRRPLAFVNPV
jgi:hypothetical protein